MSLCFILLVGIIMLYGKYGHGVEFFPESDPRRVYVDITYPEGTNLETSNKACFEIEKVLRKKEDIRYIITTVGSQSDAITSAIFGGGGGNPHLSRVMFEFYDFEKPLTDNQLRLFVAIIENDIHFDSPPGSNGLTGFEYVFRTFLSSNEGDEFQTDSNSKRMDYSFTWQDWDYNNCQVIAFIQNMSTKQIIQTTIR